MNLRARLATMSRLRIRTLVGDETVTYRHKRTNTDYILPGYRLDKESVKDPVGGQTTYQDVPQFRIADLPVAERDFAGDIVIDASQAEWKVNNLVKFPSGETIAYVSLTKRGNA